MGINLAGMRKISLVVFSMIMACGLSAQNKIRINTGYQTTFTTVAEYLRPGESFYRIDSVFLKQRVHAPAFSLIADIDMNKGVYLSTGFAFSKKGIKSVTYPNYKSAYYETWLAAQYYFGLVLNLTYRVQLGEKAGMFGGVGARLDLPYGIPTNAARATGRSSEFVVPFGRLDCPDLSWTLHLGGLHDLGPGEVVLELSFLAGLTNVINDAYIYGRSASFVATIGYALHLK